MAKQSLFAAGLAAIGVLALSACQPPPVDYAAQYKPLEDTFIAVWNGGSIDGLDAVVAATYHRNGTGGTTAEDLASLKKVITGYRTAFPDAKVTIDESQYWQGHGFFRWTFTGTNTGAGDIPPTGKSVKVSGMSEVAYEGGKIADETLYFDSLDYFTQLGYTVTPPASEPAK